MNFCEEPLGNDRRCSKLEHVEQLEDTCTVCGLVPLVRGLTKDVRVVAESPAMQEVLRRAARFAASDAPVALTGETGTGKEVVARIIHRNSARADEPFIAVNVAALPAELLESELFGHGKGAFTGATGRKVGLFEEAHGGTLFLDEISEMAMPLQAKLLRVLQDGEVRRVGETRPFAVDVRVISATHRNSLEQVRRGAFREDLHYRLHVLSLELPSLRRRAADILPLAMTFLEAERRSLRGFDAGAQAVLLAYAWPGNVRELHNAVRHGAALATGPYVSTSDLPETLHQPTATSSTGPLRTLADVEKEHVLRVLRACEGSQVDAARVLGIARNTLWRKLQSYS